MAAQAGLCLALLETPKDRFCHVVAHIRDIFFNPSNAAIKISINATAAEFICKNFFPTPVQVKKNYRIGEIQQIFLYQNVCK